MEASDKLWKSGLFSREPSVKPKLCTIKLGQIYGKMSLLWGVTSWLRSYPLHNARPCWASGTFHVFSRETSYKRFLSCTSVGCESGEWLLAVFHSIYVLLKTGFQRSQEISPSCFPGESPFLWFIHMHYLIYQYNNAVSTNERKTSDICLSWVYLLYT